MALEIPTFEYLFKTPLLIKKIEGRKMYLCKGEINITLDIPEEKVDQMKNFKVGDSIVVQDLN